MSLARRVLPCLLVGCATAPLVAQRDATAASTHWAFVGPIRPAVPAVGDPDWVRNPIDAFVLRKLEAAGLTPSVDAGKRVLIRRLALDLTGLLPTVEEVERFVADDSAAAYERLVDRYLASPHYGERWARYWLDVARYADSNGYSIDGPRSIWPYRDWVIDAINDDRPFDRFVVEQLAGDLLPNPTSAQRIATGFHRNTMINQEGGVDREEFRIEAVKDRVNTTSTAFLGLTLACAQCHDHKYDPFTQREYYELFAFFNDDDERDFTIVAPEDRARYDAVRAQLKALEQEASRYERSRAERDAGFSRKDDAGWRERQQSIAALSKRLPKTAKTLVLQRRETPRESWVHLRGDFTQKGETVEPGVPAVLPPLEADGRGTRLDLARWLVDPANPLTARVTVNRIWQRLFGRGLVGTENDFGAQGDRPTHPWLLDWLATEFVRRGFSRKALVRLIVTSSTYRQASTARAEIARIDPRNELLARQNRLRLDAEIVRDASLCASGLLAAKIGGPSVFPPQPRGVMTLGQSKHSWRTSKGEDRYRRGMYTQFWRATPHPALAVFDAPSALEACTRRNRSNTPLQALTLLNEEQFFECARALARRICDDKRGDAAGRGDAARIEHGFLLCVGREPASDEKAVLARLLEREREAFAADPEAALAIAGNDSATVELAAFTVVSRVLLNLDEFITRQ